LLGALKATFRYQVIKAVINSQKQTDHSSELRLRLFRRTSPDKRRKVQKRVVSGLSLALIGDASEDRADLQPQERIRGVFDKETRRKPLMFGADAVISRLRSMGIEWRFG
jgi:hypothetical protein